MVQEGTGWFMAHFLNAFFDLFTTQFLLDQYTEDVPLFTSFPDHHMCDSYGQFIEQ